MILSFRAITLVIEGNGSFQFNKEDKRMIKVGTMKQLKMVQREVEKLPRAVVEEVKGIVSILDDAYGATRDVETDLGGFVVIVQCKEELLNLQQEHHVTLEDYEFIEPIQADRDTGYVYVLYQVSSDYAVAVISERIFIEVVIAEKEQ